MKFRLYMVLFLLVLSGSVLAAGNKPLTLKVMQYNIHHGADESNKMNLDLQADLIANEKPDLVSLNECYGGGVKFGNQAKELADLLNKRTGKKWYWAHGTNVKFVTELYGTAVLSKYPIKKYTNLHLPRVPESNEQRGLLSADIRIPNAPLFRFHVTHLAFQGFATTERELSVAEIEKARKAFSGPQILAGDFNSRPAASCIQTLVKNWQDTWVAVHGDKSEGYTFNALNPKQRIDYIFVPRDPSFSVITSYVPDDDLAKTVSDHRPLVSVIQYLPAKKK